jgi:hypothetical protein
MERCQECRQLTNDDVRLCGDDRLCKACDIKNELQLKQIAEKKAKERAGVVTSQVTSILKCDAQKSTSSVMQNTRNQNTGTKANKARQGSGETAIRQKRGPSASEAKTTSESFDITLTFDDVSPEADVHAASAVGLRPENEILAQQCEVGV